MSTTKRATIYLDEALHRALRVKAAETDRSVSELVNAAVRTALTEDAEDLATFRERAKEPTLAFEDVLRDLKRRANYNLGIKRSAAKELEALPLKDRRRIVARGRPESA